MGCSASSSSSTRWWPPWSSSRYVVGRSHHSDDGHREGGEVHALTAASSRGNGGGDRDRDLVVYRSVEGVTDSREGVKNRGFTPPGTPSTKAVEAGGCRSTPRSCSIVISYNPTEAGHPAHSLAASLRGRVIKYNRAGSEHPIDINIHFTEMIDDEVVDEGVVRAYRIPPELAECSIYLPLVSPKWIQSSIGSRHVRFMARRKILESATKPSRTMAVALGWLIPRQECQVVLSNMLGSTAASPSASVVQVVEWSTPDAVTEGLERCILQAAQSIVYTRELDHHYRLWRQYSTTTAEERKEGDVSGSAEDEKENSEGVLHSSTGDVDESSYRKESAVGEGTQRRVVEPGPPLPPPQTGHAFALVPFTTDSGPRMTDDDLYRTRNSSDFHTDNWDGVPEELIESFDLAGNKLNIDDRVLLLGLKTCQELNGRVGCIRRVIPDGRVEVDITDTVTSDGMRVCRRARLQSSKVQRLEPDQLVIAAGSLSPRSDDNVVGSGARGDGQTLRRDTTVHPADISALWSNGPGAPQPPPGMPVIPTKPPASPPAAVVQPVGNPTSDERETNPHAVEGRPRLQQLCDGVIEDGDEQEEDRSTPQRDATMDLPGAPPGMPTLEQLAGGTRRVKASSGSEDASLRGAARYRSRPVSEDTYRRRRSRLEEREEFQGHLNSIEGVAIPLPATRKQMEAAEGSREQRNGNNHPGGVPPMMPTFHDLHLVPAAAAADGHSQESAQKEDASEDVSSVMDIIEDDGGDEHHPDGNPQQPPTARPIIIIGRNGKWRIIEKVSSYGYIAQLLPGRPLYDKALPSSRRVAIRAIPITSDAQLSLVTDKLDLVLSKVSTNTPPCQQQHPPPQLLAILGYDVIPPQPAFVLSPSPRGLGRPPLQGTVEKYVVVYSEWCPLGTVHDLLMDLRHANSTDAAADIVLDESTNGLEEALVRKYVWYTLVGLHWLHHHELYHGHLCSHALMLDGMDNSVKLEGYALPFTQHHRQPLPPLIPGMVVDNEGGDAPAATAAYWTSPELQGISPSQSAEAGVMAKGDIWSLGCLAIEMLTGTHPRYTTTLHQDISDIIPLDDSAIPFIPSEVSDTGRDFIARCLQRNPHLRPSTKELMMHPWMLLISTPRPESDGAFIACLLTIDYPTPAAPLAVTSPSNEGASAMPPSTTDATTEEPEEDASVEESMLYPSSAPLLFVTHRLCTIPPTRAVEGGSSGGAFESAISYRVPYLLDGFGVGPLDPVSFTAAFCFRAAEPCLPLPNDPVPVRYDHHPPHGGPSVSFLVYSSAPSHHLAVQLGLARICEFESGALIPEPTLKRHFGEQWRRYTPPQLGRCVRMFWVRLDEEATASIGVAQRVLPPLHDIRVLVSGYTLPDALPSGSLPTPLEEGMLVSIGYATYTGWVYAAAAASSDGGRGWLPMGGALDLLTGDPDRCPFTRIGNAMVYPEPQCEDDVKDDDDEEEEEEGDGLVEDICKRMCSGLLISPINLGGTSLWCCGARKQQGCPALTWKDKANTMRSLSHAMDECPKLLTVSSRSGIGESQRKAFFFDHRSARIAAKRLTFTATTVSFRIHFNKEAAAGNFSLGFCDSITSENLTVDRSRSRVCGKGIAIDPISGTIYHTGTALVGMALSPIHASNTMVGDGGGLGGCPTQLNYGNGASPYQAPPFLVLHVVLPVEGYGTPASAVMHLQRHHGLVGRFWAMRSLLVPSFGRDVVRPVASSKASLLITTTLDDMEADHLYPPDLPRDGPRMGGLNAADHHVTVVDYTVVVASSTLKDTSPAALWSLGPLVAVAAPLARTRLIISILPHRFGLEYDSTTLCDIIDSLYQAAGEHGHPFLDVQVRLNATLPFTRGPQCPLVGAVGLMDGDKVDVLLPAVACSEDEHAVADKAPLAHFDHVLFAGTFDHLHVGHRAVITRSFLMARKTLRLALVAGELLQHKRLAKALQPFHEREKEALRFVQDVRPTDWHCDVAVIPDITRDPIGPARTLRDFDCLVVTTETAKGGAVV
ncbi:hypothetical protein FOZ63_005159, partial [Perkinsus olseni]